MKRAKFFHVTLISGLLVFGVQHQRSEAVYEESASGPNTQLDYSGNIPRSNVQQQETAQPGYAPGEIIVKFKPRVGASAYQAMEGSSGFQAITGTPSLDNLKNKYSVQKMERVFNDLEQKGQIKGLSVLDAQQDALETKAKFPQRSNRAPKDAKIPDLENIYLLHLSSAADVLAAAKEYAQDPDVEYAHPNYKVKVQMVPDDPYYSSSNSWGQGYDDLWGLKKIQTEQAWDISQGQGVIVAVIDTGLDYTHPDIKANVWKNKGEITGDGIDNDGNGFIDDIKGWDFHNNDNDPVDGHGHGTHVSGTIAAVGNNGKGIIGVAPKAKVMAVKGLSDAGSGYSSDLAEALVYAANNGADVLNNSWGCSICPSNPVVEDAVRTAHGLGAVIVFAAGNSSDDVANRSPQNMTDPKPIVVAATTQTDVRAYFSSFGALVDVAAPGAGNSEASQVIDPVRNILSLKSATCSAEMCPSSLIVGSKYLRQAGTSMAAPHVAGVAALVLAGQPAFTNEEVKTVLRATSDDLDSKEFDKNTGYGRINTTKAVAIDSPCVASIKFPSPGVFLTKPTDIFIEGTATCRAFNSYSLEVGEGVAPDSWTQIHVSSSPVIDSLLGTWDASKITDGIFTLRLTVLNNQNQVFRAYNEFYVFRNIHDGWPNDFGVFEQPAAVGDLDEDGLSDLIFSTMAPGLTVALRHDGTDLPGWPIDWSILLPNQLGDPTIPAVGDINGDGSLEVAVGAPFFYIYVFQKDGTVLPGWPQYIPGEENQVVTPLKVTLADLNNDGLQEVIATVTIWGASVDQDIYVWQANGTLLPGWPQRLPSLFYTGTGYGTLAAADVTGDGQIEIVATVSTGQGGDTACVVFDANGAVLPGWPVILSGEYNAGDYPVLGDITGDKLPEVIFRTAHYENFIFHKTIHALQSDGTYAPGWPVNADSLFPDGYGSLNNVTLGDLTGDRIPEVLVAVGTGSDNFSKIAVFQANGILLPGWPVQFSNRWPTSPLVADVNSDGHSDLVVGSYGGVYAFDSSGAMLPEWPKALPGYSVFSPTIADVDGDQKLELLIGGGLDTPLFLYDIESPADPLTLQWPMLSHDSQRSGLYVAPNHPPALEFIGDQAVDEGVMLSFSVSATDPDRDPLTLTAVNLPSGASCKKVKDEPGLIEKTCSWTPGFGQAGTYEVTFKTSDGSLTDKKKITIAVADISNLLANPDFDQDTLNWVFPANASIDTAVWQTYAKAAKLDGEGAIISTPRAAITPGMQYRVAGWIKTKDIANSSAASYGARIRVQVYDANGNLLGSGNLISGLKGTQNWTYYSKKFTAPPNAASASLQLQIVGKDTAGTAWFDGLLGAACDDSVCAGLAEITWQ